MLIVGGSFGAYDVQRRLAVGGMGEVYLCRHRILDRLDAVKVLRPHLAADPGFRRRFLREALSVARVRHPNVVMVYTADEADGLLFLAMEYVPGEDLAAVLRPGPLAPARVVALLTPVADALDAAHRAQLVHRDVKPSNVVVTPGDGVRLLDFGLSRMLDEDSGLTRTGEIVGTIAYCSPEQLSRRPISGACDQYSLACVAYECLTGEAPFRREGQLALMTAHLTAPPPAASRVRADLPPGVDAVLIRALAKDPAQRYPTCTAFMAALAAEVAEPASLRVGTSAGGPLTVRLPEIGPLAVRGTPESVAGVVRSLVAQAATDHPIRELCLVAALAGVPGENWLWLGWLPHARPSTPPVSGAHLATSPEAAADLVDRVWAVVRTRGAATSPRVLAFVDGRLVTLDLSTLGGLPRAGVDLVVLIAPGTPTPAGMSTLDVLENGRCRLTVAGRPSVSGSLETVDAAYVRELADRLPEG